MPNEDLTKEIAGALDEVRAELGPDGDLTLVAWKMGAMERTLLVISDGFYPSQTGPLTVEVEIMDRPETTRALFFGKSVDGYAFNRFRIGDQLWHLDENGITPPLGDEPRSWLIRGHAIRMTQDTAQ